MLSAVLERYGVTSAHIALIPRGRMNAHWRVDAPEAAFVLRCYTAARTPAAIAFEHDVLAHLARRAWPVALPVESSDETTWVEHGGRRYALFPFLPGDPPPARTTRSLHITGRLLARLHADLAAFRPSQQREGWSRIWELDPTPPAAHGTFNDLVREFGRHQPELATLIRGARYRNLRDLSRLGYGELPQVLIDFDFHRDNLLFQRGALTGLLDLDSVHLDARAVDLAATIANDCAEPPADIAVSPESASAVVVGYAGHTALTADEVSLIPALLVAYRLAALPAAITGWLDSRNERDLARIDRNARGRIPALFERARTLESTLLAALAEARRT